MEKKRDVERYSIVKFIYEDKAILAIFIGVFFVTATIVLAIFNQVTGLRGYFIAGAVTSSLATLSMMVSLCITFARFLKTHRS